MKVLYISPGDKSGVGVAGSLNVLALDSVGVDVVCRPLQLRADRKQDHPRILELERKSLDGITHVVQHALPIHFQYDGRFKNVGVFAWETDPVPKHWVRRLNHMDAVLAISKHQADACVNSGVTKPVGVLPHPFDTARYERSYPDFLPLKPFKDNGTFLFYGVGEWVRRKNWSGLLKAFHTEFEPSENVGLVLKTSVPGMDPAQSFNYVEQFCAEVKRGLKLRKDHSYRKEIILTGHLDDAQMLALHKTCDCYVTASFGEAWNLGCADALAMGRTPIAPRSTGFVDYLGDANSYLCDVRSEPCFGAVDAPPGLYTGREQWHSPDLNHLGKLMRAAYTDAEARRAKVRAGLSTPYFLSLETVGKHFKEMLEDI